MTGGFVFSEKPIRIQRGEGPYLYDDSGTEYLDFGASYAVTPAGHCHPEVVDAAKDQLEELMFVQASYPNDARDACYGKLASVAPGDIDNVWLCNSGTEANEAALKFARSATGRKKIVATRRGFHGRTMGALAATWKQKYKKPFEPLAGAFEAVPYGDAEALAEAVDEETAAVIVEPIQGEGGINPAPEGYLAAAREACDETGAALVFDEIQTGLGRTGEFWACEHDGVVPDILTSAKGLASGLPLGATLCRDWIAEDAGPHGSTFSGNPVVCAAASATLDVLVEEDLPTHAAEMGTYLHEEIEAADLPIRDIRGKGLMTGIEVKRGSNRLLRDLALNHRVLALPAGRSVLRLLPPLVIDEAHVDRIVGALSETMGATAES
ncbi:aspartate aminotransferase family protein [Halalkalicoccus sp. NIPERK01]|uniref:aspartate aminotransferase family protein n=1 Tax=Halalkalicoccus sp. NIPERK01 TaxID=3053469 RepID=UPI00256F4979|nr:aspartate aminotransferase family protein [Halalkalicoccus sp. NIPERK01]MDL5362866.1 aspartate aminotransferase family protein [Halalkalicoccus sp. NIPERK01]